MYLKSLALSGFKTFADDTSLTFGQGITAIVGPNGSGKSNIVDGILWALGERSHKALRGHAPTDVIFNGAAERKPMGLAEVSLFFDNADKTLPLDFAEVQVTRRIFRDGESEYSINKAKSRLRDVTDLFLDTGVGPDAYTIISQSEIDSILSAKAEDRRGLIEGAAGVQKYRARRTETRRKLDHVETDLLRVLDISTELESQLLPLAQQAELAREYDNYALRLRELQLAILAREYDVRQKRKAALDETKASSSRMVHFETDRIEKLENAESSLESQMRELEAQMDSLQSETTDVVSRLKATEGTIAVARERRRALTEQQEFQAQEIGLLRARINAAQESANTQKRELDEAVRDSGMLSSGAADAEAKLGAAVAALGEATRELQQKQSRVIELMRVGQTKREAAAGGRAEAQALQNRLQDLEKLLSSLNDETQNTTQMQTRTRDELQSSRDKAKATETEVQAAREAVQQAQIEYSKASDELGKAREERSGSTSRLKTLRELEENLEGVQGGARSVLSAVKRGQLPDDYTLVADIVRAPKELEQAIEVSLAANINNLVCERDTQAKTAIGFLKTNQAGRATFLPLNNLRINETTDKTKQLLRERGVRGIAADLVTCDDFFEPAVEYLLGRFIVVDDLETAIALAKRCDGGMRLVTIDGELVLPAGAITGGQGRQKASGLLARKRELDELENRLQELNRVLETRTNDLQTLRTKIDEVQNALRQKQESANELRSQIARQEREVEHGEREARRVKANLEATQSQIAAIKQKVESRQASQDNFESEAKRLDDEARVLDAEVAAAQTVVTQRQSERDEVANGVADVRAEYSATQERQSAMRRAVAELERQIRDFTSQIESKQATIARASGEDQLLVSRESEHISNLAQLQTRRDELEAALIKWRENRASGLQQLQETSTGLRLSRAKLHESEDELHRTEVKLASTETEIIDIERRFGEEFSMTVEDALPHRDDIESKQNALDEIEILKEKVGSLGHVNVGAIEQHEQVKERLDFLTTQREDLDDSRAQLEEIIADIDGRTRERFMATFKGVQVAFDELFQRVFDGGSTQLSLTDPDNLLETGIDLRVQPPGKGAQDISLLSGGERALTALSFMLALLRVHPSPFVVLDEVDAPLDQSNVGRFAQLLREFTDKTQFIVITHNNGTMQAADVLYGVTMQDQGVSKIVSVKLVDDDDEESSTRLRDETGVLAA